MRPPGQLSDRAKAVEEAYLRDLAWQSRRARALLDRLEGLIDGLEAVGANLFSAHSKFAIESYLHEQIEAGRRGRGLQ